MTDQGDRLPGMFDSALLGETAAKCMEALDTYEEVEDGTIDAVAIIVIARDKDDTFSLARVFCSEKHYWKQLGLMRVGLEVVEDGVRVSGEENDET